MGKWFSMPYTEKDKEFLKKYGFQPSKTYWTFAEILKALKMERRILLKKMFILGLLKEKNKVSPSEYAIDNDFFYKVRTLCDCALFHCEHIARRNNKWLGQKVIKAIEEMNG